MTDPDIAPMTAAMKGLTDALKAHPELQTLVMAPCTNALVDCNFFSDFCSQMVVTAVRGTDMMARCLISNSVG
jgi:hypothetical protein